MKKIVHVITRFDRGGSAINTLFTCLGLNEKYQLVLVHGLSLESQMTDWEKRAVDRGIEKAGECNVKVVCMPSLVRAIAPLQDTRALLSLWRFIIREKPAIVHTHTSKAGILGRLAAKLAGVPIIVHTPHGHVFYGHFSSLASRFFLLIEKMMTCITDCLVALTEGEKNDYVNLSVSEPNKIVTIHSGVDIDRYMSAKVDVQKKRASLGLAPEGLVIGTVGWLLPIKGPMHLLQAMARIWHIHPDISLVFAGKGELEDALRAEAFRRGVSNRVTFLGWRDDVPEIMQIIDVFVLPSLNEGMGRVLVEAMAAGKAIVASDTGGIPDLIKHGHNGLLVPPGDSARLAEAIITLLRDTDKRQEMGKNGRLLAQRYSVESMVNKIKTVYEELLSKNGHIYSHEQSRIVYKGEAYK